MCPIDDPSIPSLGPLAKVRRERVSGIPSQAVEAIKEEFQQALKDARSHSERPPREPSPPAREDTEEAPEAPIEDQAPPEVYGPHGEPPKPLDAHRLDLEV